MAAVRAGRAAPAAAAEWWHTLAAWARPGLAAAAVVILVVGGVALQSHGAHTDAAYKTVLDEEEAPGALVPDAELARATDTWGRDTLPPGVAAEASAAAELLSDGVKRRQGLHLDLDSATPALKRPGDSTQARREATFRYVMP